jgi:DNA polymerase-3 subunit alpha
LILSSEPLLDVVPLWMRDDGSIITGWDYPSCEDIGLLKMDFLGLRNLTIIDDAIKAVEANHGVTIDLLTLELDDAKTYELLSSGHSLGVFQLDGGGMRELLRRMQPKKFGDISAALALYRPGPMAANAHINFAERSNGRQRITPIHPELKGVLEPILGETFHLVVYQEQVMQIARDLAGYTMGGADLLRRAMGKKKKEVLEKEFEKFQAGMGEKGFGSQAIQTLWDVLLPFSGYAFNKSHTAAYGLIAYWTAYLKANYEAEYMAALLTSVGDKKSKLALYLGECRRMKIKVLPPDVNESMLHFAAVGGNIRFGLGVIRNVGANVVESIIKTRQKKGSYTSFTDFLEKAELVCCNKQVVESLIKAGAFDSFGDSRRALVQAHEEAVDAVTGLKKQEALGQFDLFGADASDAPEESTSPLAHLTLDAAEWPRKQLLSYEREMLGLYVSAHPLDGAEHLLRGHAPKPIAVLLDEAPAKDNAVTIAGIISSVERRVNKKGEPWAIVTVEDLDASVEVLFFARSYAVMHEELVQDSAVAIKGRPSYREAPKQSSKDTADDGEALTGQPPAREESMSIMADGLITLDISDAEHNPQTGPLPFELRADPRTLNSETVGELKSMLVAHRGATPLRIRVSYQGRETVLALDDYPVTVTNALLGELKALRGITVAAAG